MRWLELDDASYELELSSCKIIFSRDAIGYNLECIDYEDDSILLINDINPQDTEILFNDFTEESIESGAIINQIEVDKLVNLALPVLEIDKLDYISFE